MDKEHIHLFVWGLFGAFGFSLFLVFLLFFHHKFLEVDNHNVGNDHAELPVVKIRSRSLTAERSALVVPSIIREFSFAELEAATSKFSVCNLIKAGHSGDLFTGMVEGGVVVVIKRVQASKMAEDCFQAELDVCGGLLNQRYVVPLLGQCVCVERDEKLLVYEYMANGDLANALGMSRGSVDALPWNTRIKIALGLAEALVYLHHECRPRLAHRNIQGSSILLTENFDVKLGSWSEAQKLDAGVVPAYDIYCFGRVLLDLLSGLDVSGSKDPYAKTWMLTALPLISHQNKDFFMKQIDPFLLKSGEELLETKVMGVALLAMACIDPKTLQQLSMKKVYTMLVSLVNMQNGQLIIHI